MVDAVEVLQRPDVPVEPQRGGQLRGHVTGEARVACSVGREQCGQKAERSAPQTQCTGRKDFTRAGEGTTCVAVGYTLPMEFPTSLLLVVSAGTEGTWNLHEIRSPGDSGRTSCVTEAILVYEREVLSPVCERKISSTLYALRPTLRPCSVAAQAGQCHPA